jgi:hypothetical protein
MILSTFFTLKYFSSQILPRKLINIDTPWIQIAAPDSVSRSFSLPRSRIAIPERGKDCPLKRLTNPIARFIKAYRFF